MRRSWTCHRTWRQTSTIRFRAYVSGSSEDANVDNVRIVGSGTSSAAMALAPSRFIEATPILSLAAECSTRAVTPPARQWDYDSITTYHTSISERREDIEPSSMTAARWIDAARSPISNSRLVDEIFAAERDRDELLVSDLLDSDLLETLSAQ